ncbi:hypothetical protein ACO0LG_07435 [Undibacterium sp. Ji42W]|uniref:hypothetical protein n=1 Tax=Undibacterium sp. Ji42W TaxID=3413039 RepID=UPI003BF2BC5C
MALGTTDMRGRAAHLEGEVKKRSGAHAPGALFNARGLLRALVPELVCILETVQFMAWIVAATACCRVSAKQDKACACRLLLCSGIKNILNLRQFMLYYV